MDLEDTVPGVCASKVPPRLPRPPTSQLCSSVSLVVADWSFSHGIVKKRPGKANEHRGYGAWPCGTCVCFCVVLMCAPSVCTRLVECLFETRVCSVASGFGVGKRVPRRFSCSLTRQSSVFRVERSIGLTKQMKTLGRRTILYRPRRLRKMDIWLYRACRCIFLDSLGVLVGC